MLVDDMPDPRDLVGARVRDRDGHDIGQVQAVHADDHERVIHVSVMNGGHHTRLDLSGAEYDDAVVTVEQRDPPEGAQ